MTQYWKVLLILGALVFTGCEGKRFSEYPILQTEQDLSLNEQRKSPQLEAMLDYKILPQDRLLVTLYRNPEAESYGGTQTGALSQKMQDNGLLVDSQGYITLPLVHRIKVGGLTQGQAADRITSLYKKYLKIPTVYVEVMNKRVYVLGEVKKPGRVNMDREKMSLLEAIAEAGDMTDDAVRDNIIVISKNCKGKVYMRSVDLENFDTMNLANLVLKPNDIVYVQPDGWKEYKVNAENILYPLNSITALVQPFATIKYLFKR